MMQFHVRKLTDRDGNQGLELAYKAAYESGLVTTEFDKSIFNFKIKSIFVQPHSESFGLFIDEEMVGFAVVVYDFLPWNDHKRMIIDFFHVCPEYRSTDTYQVMMDHLRSVALQGDIKTIRMVSSNILLNANDREILMNMNGLKRTDVVYEGEIND